MIQELSVVDADHVIVIKIFENQALVRCIRGVVIVMYYRSSIDGR